MARYVVHGSHHPDEPEGFVSTLPDGPARRQDAYEYKMRREQEEIEKSVREFMRQRGIK